MSGIRPTDENLRHFGIKLLMRWLIFTARKKTTLTYGEAQERLEQECNFSYMGASGARRIGNAVAEPMQAEISKQDSDAPPLNVLLVRKNGRMPGTGECMREIFCGHYPEEAWLKTEYALEDNPDKWERNCKAGN